MASIANDRGGRRRVLFFDVQGERQVVRLGQVPLDDARAFARRLDQLVATLRMGEPLREETVRWLDSLSDSLHEKLSNVKLITARQQQGLIAWLDCYAASRESDLAPSSLRKLKQTCTLLKEFFAADRSVRSIVANDASDWRLWLRRRLSEASVKIHSGNAKTIFAEAVRRELLPRNPFLHLQGGPTPRDVERYISEEEMQTILEACPNSEWKLWFALPFYATLRVPSETQDLVWADVDFAKARLNVRDSKRARYGHGRRVVPIAPRLLQLLHDQFDNAPDGTVKVLRRRCTGYIKEQMANLVKRSGVTPWEHLFVTLRASGESWRQSQGFDVAHAAAWAGHSTMVSRRHYVRSVPESILDRAAGRIADAAQNPAQQGGEKGGNGENSELSGETKNGTSRQALVTCGSGAQIAPMGDEGFEPPTSSV